MNLSSPLSFSFRIIFLSVLISLIVFIQSSCDSEDDYSISTDSVLHESNNIFFSNEETSLILSEFIENWSKKNFSATLHSSQSENRTKNQILNLMNIM